MLFKNLSHKQTSNLGCQNTQRFYHNYSSSFSQMTSGYEWSSELSIVCFKITDFLFVSLEKLDFVM